MSQLNIAQRCIERYSCKDFLDDYSFTLFENFGNDEGIIINRIIDLFNVSNYETEKSLSNWFLIDRIQAKKIYDFIYENFEQFTWVFSGYYVGYTSLDSIEIGEQEEQLTGLYNHKTGKEYSIKYLRKVFENEGYCINDSSPNYAYYVVSGGIQVNLLGNEKLLNNFLLTIK